MLFRIGTGPLHFRAFEAGETETAGKSGFSCDLSQDVLDFMDDLAPFQCIARFVFRVGLEKRSHLIGHPDQLVEALIAKRRSVESEPLVQFLENTTQIQLRKIADSILKSRCR